MRRIVVLTTCLVALTAASTARAGVPHHRVVLPASPTLTTWRSHYESPGLRPPTIAIVRNGIEVDERGHSNNCRYTLDLPGLLMTVSSCTKGRAPIRVRYVSSTPIVLWYWVTGY